MPEYFSLSAPSRLHFGLFSVGGSTPGSELVATETNGGSRLAEGSDATRQFGGIGLMVQSPRTAIKVSAADRLTIIGPEAIACRRAIEAIFEHLRSAIDCTDVMKGRIKSVNHLPLSIEIQAAPPRHCGLGSGTQLALCTATAVMRFFGLPILGPAEMATAIGRGKRSAIGTHGFSQGGILVDRGKQNNESIAPLDFRTDFPEHWPVLIVMLRGRQGLSGTRETKAFEELPAVPTFQRKQMIALVGDRLIPGVLQQDYEMFAAAVYEFGRNSGMFFKSVQGGPYNGAAVEELVHFIRKSGVPAVGQPSWGPSVFAIAQHDQQSDELAARLKDNFGDQIGIVRTRADNRGVNFNSNRVGPIGLPAADLN